MAVDLMTESFYSKVERGVHKINSDLLLKLLMANNISPERFFQVIVGNNDPRFNEKLMNDNLWEYANNRKIDKLKEARKEFEEQDDVDEMRKLQVNLYIAAVEKSEKSIDSETRKRIKSIIMHNDWDVYSYDFLATAMYALSVDDTYQMLKLAIKSYEGKQDRSKSICYFLQSNL